jgi:hypothetical protein
MVVALGDCAFDGGRFSCSCMVIDLSTRRKQPMKVPLAPMRHYAAVLTRHP